jgi:mxaL protein
VSIRSRIASLFDKEGLLVWAALALLVVALLMPTIRFPRPAYDWIVIFDITQSMNVEDYTLNGTPVSRLDYAREAVRRALPDLPCGSRVGWGAFAEYRTLLLLAPVEVCSNYDDLLRSLSNIDGRIRWSNASEIIKGVYWAVRTSRELGFSPRVLFITDGQEAPPLDPAYRPPVLEELTKGETLGWLIGAGGYIPQPIPKEDENGVRIGYWRANDVIQLAVDPAQPGSPRSSEHLSSLREPHLRALAEVIGFDYARLEDLTSISTVMRDTRLARKNPAPLDLSWFPTLIALALLAVRFRPEWRSRRSQAAARTA